MAEKVRHETKSGKKSVAAVPVVKPTTSFWQTVTPSMTSRGEVLATQQSTQAENLQTRRNQGLTIERVQHQSRFFLQTVVHEMYRQDGFEDNIPAMEVLKEAETPADLPPEHIIEIKRAIGTIIQMQDADKELNEHISKVPTDLSTRVVQNVARSLLANGAISWPKVISLIYLAYKVCKNALNIAGLFCDLIECIVDVMKERVINWIFQRGGWDDICVYAKKIWMWNDLIFLSIAAIVGGVVIYKINRNSTL